MPSERATNATTEQAILSELVEEWVGVGLEFVRDAPNVERLYFYASSELGVTYLNLHVDQDGEVRHLEHVTGGGDRSRVRGVHQAMGSDLRAAEAAFVAASIPPPTEYRIAYTPATRGLDVELSREIKYPLDGEKHPMVDGFADWLGDRAPKTPF